MTAAPQPFTEFEPGDAEVGLRFRDFQKGLSAWAWMQDRPVTVAEAALTWNTTPDMVKQAVEDDAWMYLNGDLIEHDGE